VTKRTKKTAKAKPPVRRAFVVLQEDQNDHGYIDTSVMAVVFDENEAVEFIKELEDLALKEGEHVYGREEDWPDRSGSSENDADWTQNFTYQATKVYEKKK
jgi:hypothetical protein